MFIILLIALAIDGFIFLGIGLKVIFTKQPLIVSGNVIRTTILLGLLPVSLKPVTVNHHLLLNLIMPAMWLIILVMVWKQSSGYKIFGISNPAFREALITALNKMQITFQEDMSGVTLISENVHLETIVMSNGLATLRVKDKLHRARLKELAFELKQYFESTPVKTTLTISILYSILGFITITAVAALFTTHL